MNRPHGWTDYQEKLGRVTAYIHDHLDQTLDLQTLADVAHVSPFHWHRIYHALCGETLSHTVLRLRMHRATGYLANTALAVAQIAPQCGYPNAQSFTRAFRGVYGMGPAQYRAQGGHTLFQGSQAQPEAAGYQVDVRQVAPVTLAGTVHKGSYMLIGKAFQAAYTRMAAHDLVRPATRWLAVYDDDPFAVPEAQLSSRAGLSLPPGATAPAPLQEFTLGGGRCAVLRHQGPYATMRAAYHWLYGRWLVESGQRTADLPVFEEYLNNPRDTTPAYLLTDIFLPLLP